MGLEGISRAAKKLAPVLAFGAMVGCSYDEARVLEKTTPSSALTQGESLKRVPSIDRSLGAREALTPEVLSELTVENATLEFFEAQSEGANRGPYLLLPSFHSYGDDSNNPDRLQVHRDMNRQLFEAAELLLLTYNIRKFGFEGLPQVQVLREVRQKPEYTDMSIDELVDFFNRMNIELGGGAIDPDTLAIFKVALDETLTFPQRRARLLPYLDRGQSYRLVIQAIYGDSSDVEFVGVDSKDYMKRSVFDDQVQRMIFDVRQDSPLVQTIDLETGVIRDPMRLSDLREAALSHDLEAMVLYCGYRRHYRGQLDQWRQEIHREREATVVAQLSRDFEPVLIDFGTYHADALVEGFSTLGSVVRVQVDALHAGNSDYPEDASLFTPEVFLEEARSLVPDFEQLQLPTGETFYGCAPFLDSR